MEPRPPTCPKSHPNFSVDCKQSIRGLQTTFLISTNLPRASDPALRKKRQTNNKTLQTQANWSQNYMSTKRFDVEWLPATSPHQHIVTVVAIFSPHFPPNTRCWTKQRWGPETRDQRWWIPYSHNTQLHFGPLQSIRLIFCRSNNTFFEPFKIGNVASGFMLKSLKLMLQMMMWLGFNPQVQHFKQ